MARIELDEIVQGLGLLGNVLSLPRQVQSQQVANEQTRALLQGSGIPEEMIKTATPEPMMRWLSAGQPGFGGKVLGGVGDVGSILSTVVGKPVKAPRMEISDIAAASKLRTGYQESLAKKRLGEVILDPKSTKRQIAEAAVAAGSTDQAIRMLRGDAEGRPPASILGLRGAIESMDPDDPRRAKYQAALDDQLEYERQRRAEEDRLIRERQPPHYPPEEVQHRRHEQIIADRKADAARLNLKEGTPEYDYFMSYGHPRVERQAPAPATLDEEIDKERRRRDAMLRDPLQKDKVADMEPVEVTARRNLAARREAAGKEKAGEPIPAPPPPPPAKPGSPRYKRESVEQAGIIGGGLGTVLGGKGETPTSTTTTTTTPPADDPFQGADFDSLPPDVQKQVIAAAKAGMPDQEIANWLLYLRQQPQAQPQR